MQTAADRQQTLPVSTPLAPTEAGLRLPSNAALRASLLRALLLTCAVVLWLLPTL